MLVDIALIVASQNNPKFLKVKKAFQKISKSSAEQVLGVPFYTKQMVIITDTFLNLVIENRKIKTVELKN